jgi:hypothetical protein
LSCWIDAKAPNQAPGAWTADGPSTAAPAAVLLPNKLDPDTSLWVQVAQCRVCRVAASGAASASVSRCSGGMALSCKGLWPSKTTVQQSTPCHTIPH